MSLRMVTPPVNEPVNVAELRERLGITDSSNDVILDAHLLAARQELENWLGRALITQQWDLYLDRWPCVGARKDIQVPLPPLITVDSVNYIGSDGFEATVSGGNYEVDNYGLFGWIVPVSGFSWPTPMDTYNAVRIRFTAGYGPDGSDVPEPIRAWIVKRCAVLRLTTARSDPFLRSETVEGVGSQSWSTSATEFSDYSDLPSKDDLMPYSVRIPVG